MAAIREYFPGANTPMGFYSYYDYILKSREAKRIVILKGGPGTGKSTFMKNIARHLISLGYETELLHCSSDPNSLDGVCAREVGFLILDGTAPHIVDPKIPGAVGEIINLGQFWEKGKISENKAQIIQISENISSHFARAYRYLSAAKSLGEQIEYDFSLLSDMGKVRGELNKILKELELTVVGAREGTERKAFLSAITPIGKVNYIDTFAQSAKNVYKIEAKYSPYSKMFFSSLAYSLKSCGYDIRTFYCPMSPDKGIEHIYVEGLNTFFTTENAFHGIENADTTYTISLDDCVQKKKISSALLGDIEQYNLLLKNAENAIRGAKKLHDELEGCYISYMDFGKVESVCEDVIKTIK